MIDFRYHVISIVAIFLALATGIALGAGPLKGGIDNQLVNQAERDRQDKLALRTELDLAAQQADFHDAYVNTTATSLLDARLEGRSVALMLLPGADRDIAAGVADDVAAAGGTVTGTLSIQPDLLDPLNRLGAEGLATQVLAGVEGLPPTAGASSYTLVGYSLARAFLSPQPQGAPFDGTAQTIAASFASEKARYVTTDDDVARRAGLAIVIAADTEQVEPAQEELLTILVQAMDTASAGVVVTAGAPSIADGGYVAAIRDSDVAQDVSTVDVADTAAGQVVTVLAAAEQADGKAGQYGIDAADGAMPDIALDPAPDPAATP